jgi:hypothetical protein
MRYCPEDGKLQIFNQQSRTGVVSTPDIVQFLSPNQYFGSVAQLANTMRQIHMAASATLMVRSCPRACATSRNRRSLSLNLNQALALLHPSTVTTKPTV